MKNIKIYIKLPKTRPLVKAIPKKQIKKPNLYIRLNNNNE